jgi:hypothetical protein
MVKKNFHRNKRKSKSLKKTKRLKRRKSLLHKKTKRLKKRKSQKKKINFQKGGGKIYLNEHIKPGLGASKEVLNESINDFIDKFLSENEGKTATLSEVNTDGTYTTFGNDNREIVNHDEEELTRQGSGGADEGTINRINLRKFIHKNKTDPQGGLYFRGGIRGPSISGDDVSMSE